MGAGEPQLAFDLEVSTLCFAVTSASSFVVEVAEEGAELNFVLLSE